MMKRLPLCRILLALALCLVLACPALAEGDTTAERFDAALTDYFADFFYPTWEAWVGTASSRALYAATTLLDTDQTQAVNWDCPVILTWELEYPVLNYIDDAKNLCELAYIPDSSHDGNGVFYKTPFSAAGWISPEPTWDEIAKRFASFFEDDEYAYVTHGDYMDALAAIVELFDQYEDAY